MSGTAKKFALSILKITLATGAGLLMLWGCFYILDLTLETSSTTEILVFDEPVITEPQDEESTDRGTDPHFDMRMS